MVNVVILLTNGDIKDINLKLKSAQLSKTSIKLITSRFIKKYLDTIGDGQIKLLETWDIDEDHKLQAFAYTAGSVENNHELPPSLENERTIYGDIVMIKVNKNLQILELNAEEYENIYNTLYGNNCDSDSNSDSELDYDTDNITDESDEDDDEEDDDEAGDNEENADDIDDGETNEDSDNDDNYLEELEDNYEEQKYKVLKTKINKKVKKKMGKMGR